LSVERQVIEEIASSKDGLGWTDLIRNLGFEPEVLDEALVRLERQGIVTRDVIEQIYHLKGLGAKKA
jgi:DNA-binding HxlR family transcriptional regulator